MKRLSGAALVVLLWSVPIFSQVREIGATGEYRMGDNDTKATARALALEQAKRNALEQAGTFVSSLVRRHKLIETISHRCDPSSMTRGATSAVLHRLEC